MTPRVLLILAGAEALLGVAACTQRSRPATPRPAADSVEVGYGALPRDKVTGAVTTLSEKDLSVRPLRIEELLRGKVPGLQIIRQGDRVSFRIRGTNSALVDQEPLVIVDNVMIQEGNIASALAGLTTDDISQVNVLKDVASTSIYGFRGAGGVILITTKAKRENRDR
jgi:TonB-dependent SusC/RagA subfamily outer membrane receptor